MEIQVNSMFDGLATTLQREGHLRPVRFFSSLHLLELSWMLVIMAALPYLSGE